MQRSVNLKFYLTQNRIKVERLQKITGWSRSTTFRKLKGTSIIDDGEVKKIANAFNVSDNIFDLDERSFEEIIISNDNVPVFLKNVNIYIEEKKIRKDLIAKKMGIHSTTLERYLKAEHYVGQDEMVRIANALKKTVEYFLGGNITAKIYENKEQLAFFSGEPSGEQVETTNNLIEFINYHDALLSISRLTNM